jgi:hypothetical protein
MRSDSTAHPRFFYYLSPRSKETNLESEQRDCTKEGAPEQSQQ